MALKLLKEDVNAAVDNYPGLRLKKEEFTFNHGITKMLSCLEGTIPVLYNSSTRNIHVAIFLHENHPHEAPMVYVRPTSTMQIKANDLVDTDGLVRLDYISEWKHPGSDLVGLLSVLQVSFDGKPYVYSELSTATPQPMGPAPYPPAVSVEPLQSSGAVYPAKPDYQRIVVLSREQLLPSVRSAVVDKIRREQRELIYQYQAELEAIEQNKLELSAGHQKLLNMMKQMQVEQRKASADLKKLQKENDALEERYNSQESSKQKGFDDAVTTPYELYRQLLYSFTREKAIEDAMTSLHEALGKNVLDLNTYLENIRALSKEQFQLRLTVLRCRREAELPV